MAGKKQNKPGEERNTNMEEVVKDGPKIINRSYGGFFGREITPQNKNQVFNEFFATFLDVEAKKPEFAEETNETILKFAAMYASHHINSERKHRRAYLKGKNYYTYKGMKYPVMTLEKKIMATDMIRMEQQNKTEEE